MTSTRRFRFGAVLGGRGAATAWGETARGLEDAGYATVLVPDTVATAAPFQVLAVVAATTSSLHVGTWVLSAPLRGPQKVVREARTLWELSDGRLELGVGAGRPGGEHDAAALGVPWGTAGERVRRVEQTLSAVALDPAPPIVVAASGDRMLRLAGRYADTLALPLPPTADAAQIAALAEHVRAGAGKDLELALQMVGVGEDVPEQVRRWTGLTAAQLRESGAAALLTGDVEADADHLRGLRERTGVSYLTVPGDLTSRMAPLVARLAGT